MTNTLKDFVSPSLARVLTADGWVVQEAFAGSCVSLAHEVANLRVTCWLEDGESRWVVSAFAGRPFVPSTGRLADGSRGSDALWSMTVPEVAVVRVLRGLVGSKDS